MFDEGAADMFPSPNREEPVPDELQHLANMFHLEIEPPEGDLGFDELHEEDRLDEVASEDYNYKEDLQSFVPNWTAHTPNEFRDNAVGRFEGEREEEPALELHQLNAEQRQLVKWLRFNTDRLLPENSQHQFLLELCGGAGTGKTTTIRTFMQELKRAHPHLGVGNMVHFAAPTGCACKLLPNPHSTLHKLLHLPLGQQHAFEISPMTLNVRTNVQEAMANVKLLIIDEKSFIGSYYMYVLDTRLREIFTKDKPFGGLSIVLMGDYAQLTPVGDHPVFLTPRENNRRGGKQKWSFYQIKGHNAYIDNFTDVLSLSTSMRQNADPDFANILKKMDDGPLSPDDYDKLAQRDFDKLSALEKKTFEDDVLLAAMKKDYHPFNITNIGKLPSPKVLIKAVNSSTAAAKSKEDDAGNLKNNLLLARGMRVMLTKNIDVPAGLSNGSIGEVVGILFFSEENATDDNATLRNEIPTVLVQFRDYKGPSVEGLGLERVYPISAYTATWSKGGESLSRRMLPLQPAYGCTIHKSQGQTLNKIMINLGPREFSGGLTYTALTRVRSLKDLAFRPMPDLTRLNAYAKHINFDHVKADKARKAAMTEATLARFAQQQVEQHG